VFTAAVTARHVSEPLQTCGEGEALAAVTRRMADRGFDVLGVRGDGGIVGYVERSDRPRGRVGAHVRVFHPSELVADSTPLIEVLRRLGGVPRVFVLSSAGVTGIATRGDLQKAPVRAYAFGLVTIFEMTLTERLREVHGEEGWRSWLPAARVEKATEVLALQRTRNEELDLLECLHLADKLRLATRSPLFSRMAFGSGVAARRCFRRVEELRNRLAHGRDLVAGSTWPEVIETVTTVKDLTDRLEDPGPMDGVGSGRRE
jgi:hypothetical protein